MKPILIMFFVLTTILSACTPTSNPLVIDISTPTDEPIATILATAEPTTDENIIGTWYDTWAASAGSEYEYTIIIRKINGTYQITKKFNDGSEGTDPLTVKIVDGEERLYENPGNYYGDYMVIKSNGNLAFYDNQGFIYEDQPKSSTQSIINTPKPTTQSSRRPLKNPLPEKRL